MNDEWLNLIDISELSERGGRVYRKLYLQKLLRYMDSFDHAIFYLYHDALNHGITEMEFADCLKEQQERLSRGEY